MSYTYLQAAGAVSSAECFSDIEPSALLKLSHTDARSYCNANGTASCLGFQFGMTSEPLTPNRGAGEPTLFAEDFPARTLASAGPVLESQEAEADSGKKWPEWFAKLDRVTSSWRIRQLWLFADLEQSLATWPRWGMMHDGECWELETPGGCMNAIGSGLLHIPTIGKNEFKGSSRKRFIGSLDFRGAKMSEGLRTCASDPQYTAPCFAEDQMGWPIMWSASQPLETAKFQAWLRSHSEHYPLA